ncbi:hypothetical protein JCM5296_002740 [Sporobolomyces johnsonii]
MLHRPLRAAVTVGLVLSPLIAQASSDSKVSPTTPPITFFWATYNDTFKEIPQCAGFQVYTTANAAAANKVVEPLYFTTFPTGYQPTTMELPSSAIGDGFTWSADYPVGTKITFAMTDSANHSGGAVDGYTISQSSYNNCTIQSNTTAPISLAVNPENNPCDEIDLTISGGRAPYTISVLAGLSGLYANVTTSEKKVQYGNIVAAGQAFNLLVTDSTGATSAFSQGMTSALNLGSCSRPSKTSSSSAPVGAIVGGVVGGIVAAAILALVAWLLLRRRSANADQHYHQQQITTSEFRNADGRAPLVEPFMVPLQTPGGGAVDPYDDRTPSNDGSYDKSLVLYPSPPAATAAGAGAGGMAPHDQKYLQHPMHQQPSAPPPPLEQAQHYAPYPLAGPYSSSSPYDPYDPAPPHSSASGGYSSYDPSFALPGSSTYETPRSAAQPSSSSATDDLANPEEFEYRLADSTGWRQSSQLPPPARGY